MRKLPRLHCEDCGKELGRNARSRGQKRCKPCAARIAGLAKRGKTFGPKERKNMSIAHVGKTLPQEHRERIGEGLKKYYAANPIPRGSRHLPESQRKNIAKSNIGKHQWTEEQRIHFRLLRTGHPVSEETRAKISGPNNPHYRDGRSQLPYTPDFPRIKAEIRKRDGCLCQHPRCYVPENGRKHECHHIDRNKANNRPDNLILLCTKHHHETRVGDADYWVEFYQEVQAMRGI